MDGLRFFQRNTRVVALPTWENPRLMLPAGSVQQRWRGSALYPAHRPAARLYRLALRTGVALGFVGRTRIAISDQISLCHFAREALPNVAALSVLIGTPGEAQKVSAELRDDHGRVLGYLKYGERPTAVARLRHEWEVLRGLPSEIGPRPLTFGAWADGVALVTTPVPGAAVPARLPPPSDLATLCSQLASGVEVEVEEHPWILALRERTGYLPDAWIEPLALQGWSIVRMHGDLAWNLRRTRRGDLNAFDWEYGALQGFPGIDLATYIVETAQLRYGWSPRRTWEWALPFLRRTYPQVPERALPSLVRLAALHLFQHQVEEGWDPNCPLQRWRTSLWERAT